MRNPALVILVILLFGCRQPAATTGTAAEKQSFLDGEQLYKINCAQCHKLNEEFVGPPLKDAASRWQDKKDLYEFVRNSGSMILKNKYASQLAQKYNQSIMPPMPQLSDEEIDAILLYANSLK